MNRTARSPLPRRGRITVAATTAVLGAALAATVLTAPPAVSAVEDTCPEPFPAADLVEGDPVHGLTVSHGTEPDDFVGEYVDVIPDGIALGTDMILVKLSGSVITDENGDPDRGIWAGMSGSPVYAADGRLIGAVSYGLTASPSAVAGVTPAAAMYDLGRYDGLQLHETETVPTTPRATARLRSLGVPARQARRGYARLPMPTNLAGLAGDRLGLVTRRLGLDATALDVSGGGSAALDAPADAIFPGSNVAMAMSYGDVTASAVGTTTAVCDDAVLAFGHPFNLSGRTTASLHGARAHTVERDTVFGSYKIATPTAPVGVFTQDRLAGVLGRLGRMPDESVVTARVTTTEGDDRTGTTRITDPGLADQIATIHLMGNLDSAFNGYRPGTGTLGWTITVRRQNGSLARLRYEDVYASGRDLAAAMPWEFYLQLRAVLANPYESVELVGVRQHAHLSDRFRQRRIGDVQIRRAGRWSTLGRRSVVGARPGATLRLRTWLEPSPGSDVRRMPTRLSVRVPRSAGRGFGMLLVHGGQLGGRSGVRADSLPGLLRGLAKAPGNTTVNAELRLRGSSANRVSTEVTRRIPVGGLKAFGVAVR